MADNFSFVTESEELLKTAIRRFAAWAGENWEITMQEAETLTKPTAAPKEYVRGYNDGIRSICDAADLWMEDEL